MPWYRAGTVTVANGSPVVTGAGTDFVANTQAGEVFLGPDGRVYEISAVPSATELRIVPNYQGASAGGQGYGIQPTSSFARDLAIAVAALIASFAAVRDGVGQGLFPDGSPASPGVRFAADQDTGLFRVGANALGLVTGGVISFDISADGMVTLGRPTENAFTATLNRGLLDGFDLRVANGVSGSAAGLSKARLGLFYGGSKTNEPAALDFLRGGGGTDGALAIRTSGAERVRFDPSGNVGIGVLTPAARLDVGGMDGTNIYLRSTGASPAVIRGYVNGVEAGLFRFIDGGQLAIETAGNERLRLSSAGNLLVGVPSGSNHVIYKPVTENAGNAILTVYGNGGGPTQFYAVSAVGYNGANAAMKVAYDATTGRSLNAGGTLNASGADYAEYVRKAGGCGAIAKGDVCGINRDGALVRSWADAIRFVVKSTDPNLVGGDTWAAHLGQRPAAPIYEAPSYDGPAEPVRPEAPEAYTAPEIALPVRPIRNQGESDDDYTDRVAAYLVERSAALAAIDQSGAAEAESAAAQARYVAALRQYEVDRAAYDAARRAYDDAKAATDAAHEVAVKVHASTLAKWEADLEAARQTVDRIAFSGQVPVNVDADTLTACEAALVDGEAVYLVGVARGAGIGVAAVREVDMTLPQYMRRVGCVWAIRDGRPWVDVQHG